ncbi:MAG: glyoxalase superfamily protein [Rhodocyclaceae bacterium]
MHFTTTIPILRIFDEAVAHDFYIGFLGFAIDWQHRFADDLPLYLQVSRGGCVLHLSGHHGDACPGAAVRIETHGIEDLHHELAAKQYKFARPAQEPTPWGSLDLRLTDPFGNRLIFSAEPAAASGY